MAGDKGDGGRKTAGRGEMCVRRYRVVLAAKRVRAYELNLSSLYFSQGRQRQALLQRDRAHSSTENPIEKISERLYPHVCVCVCDL